MRTTDVTGAIGLPDGAEMIMPGDNVDMTVELITRSLWSWTAFCHPRGWTHCRRRGNHHDHRVENGKVDARPIIQLACTECKMRTYTTRKNKKNDPADSSFASTVLGNAGTRFIARPSRQLN